MELQIREVLVILAMVDRLHVENILLRSQLDRLMLRLIDKGIFTEQERAELEHAVQQQRRLCRQGQAAENEPGNPLGAPFHRELSEALQALGVMSDNPTIGDSLEAKFQALLETVLERFRSDSGDGDAGRSMRR